MTKILHSRARALAGAALVAAIVATPTAAFAAGEVTGSSAGDGRGYNNVLGTLSANTHWMQIEGGTKVEVYCVDETVAYNATSGVVFKSQTRAQTGIANLGKAADIASKGTTLGTKLTDANAEVVAEQLAIWHLTNNFDYSKVNNASIRNRATALLAKATAITESPESANISVTTASTTDNKVTLTVKLDTAQGTALTGKSVQVSAPGETTTLTTGKDGTASVTFAAPKTAGTATVTYNGVLPAGTVLAPAAGQRVITTTSAPFTRTATAPVPAAQSSGIQDTSPSPSPTSTDTGVLATPTPVAPPVSGTPSASPKSSAQANEPKTLPDTGGWVNPWEILGAAVVGAGAIFLRRRNRAH